MNKLLPLFTLILLLDKIEGVAYETYSGYHKVFGSFNRDEANSACGSGNTLVTINSASDLATLKSQTIDSDISYWLGNIWISANDFGYIKHST
jgi:hypothetical protein